MKRRKTCVLVFLLLLPSATFHMHGLSVTAWSFTLSPSLCDTHSSQDRKDITLAAQLDDYEPDDSFADATPISFGEIQQHSLFPIGDLDYFVFILPRDTPIWISVVGITENTTISVSNASYGRILMNFFPETADFLRLEVFLQSGTYYASIGDIGVGDQAIVPEYNISLDFAQCETDAYESDNSNEEATLLLDGDWQNHSILPMFDLDWITFILENPAAVSLTVACVEDGLEDLQLRLFGQDGHTMIDETSSPVDGQLKLECLLDFGQYYAVVNVFDVVPYPETVAQYSLRFDMEPMGITVEQPNADSIVSLGEECHIIWTSLGEINKVMIELIGDDDDARLIDIYAPNTGNYTWIVPEDIGEGSGYQIKVAAVRAQYVMDTSDCFSIRMRENTSICSSMTPGSSTRSSGVVKISLNVTDYFAGLLSFAVLFCSPLRRKWYKRRLAHLSMETR